MGPRTEGEEPLAASQALAGSASMPSDPADLSHVTRAHHSILLERPLTMSGMRANVFVAPSREPELSKH